METFCEQLRFWRKNKGLSQLDLSLDRLTVEPWLSPATPLALETIPVRLVAAVALGDASDELSLSQIPAPWRAGGSPLRAGDARATPMLDGASGARPPWLFARGAGAAPVRLAEARPGMALWSDWLSPGPAAGTVAAGQWRAGGPHAAAVPGGRIRAMALPECVAGGVGGRGRLARPAAADALLRAGAGVRRARHSQRAAVAARRGMRAPL